MPKQSKGFLALVGLAFEIKLIISPDNPQPGILAWILPFPANTFTTWTAVTILRASCLSASIAIQHLDVLFPKSMTELSGKEKAMQEQQALVTIHGQSDALRQGGALIESLTAQLAADEIKPLTHSRKEGPSTLGEAARQAAFGGGAAEPPRAPQTKNEVDWIHLVAQEMVLHALKSDPTVVAIVQQQQQKSQEEAQPPAEQGADGKPSQQPSPLEETSAQADASPAEISLPESKVQIEKLHEDAKNSAPASTSPAAPTIFSKQEEAQGPRPPE